MPLFDTVVVDARKLAEYCLSHSHHRGRNKARVFRSRLGLTETDAAHLRAALMEAVRSRPRRLRLRGGNQYGQHYMLDFEMTTSPEKRPFARFGLFDKMRKRCDW